jgi:O-acetyl-ADP-ribose deacetylase
MKQEKIEVVRGDITRMKVGAIVNAANKSLLGGGGVDGAIHQAAGPKLLLECSGLNGCETGNAKITKGYDLEADYVIHTVGPVWRGGDSEEHELLASCYQKTLALAKEKKIKTIAFPGISTGIYGFPKEQAAFIAVSEIRRFMKKNSCPEKVIFVAFDDDSFKIYQSLLNQ